MTPEEENIVEAAYRGYITGLLVMEIPHLITMIRETLLNKKVKEEDITQYILERSNEMVETIQYVKERHPHNAGKEQ